MVCFVCFCTMELLVFSASTHSDSDKCIVGIWKLESFFFRILQLFQGDEEPPSKGWWVRRVRPLAKTELRLGSHQFVLSICSYYYCTKTTYQTWLPISVTYNSSYAFMGGLILCGQASPRVSCTGTARWRLGCSCLGAKLCWMPEMLYL